MAATLEPGAIVSEIARDAKLHPSQLYGWRRQLRARSPVGFAPVRIASEASPAAMAGCGAIEIELATGTRVRITGAVDGATLTAATAALADGRRR